MPFTARLYDDAPPVQAASRRRTRLPASLSHSSNKPHHVIVHNLSSHGCLIESYHPLAVGAEITMEVGGLGEARARVIWRQDAFYDCVFETPIDADRVRAKVTSAKIVWGPFGQHHRKASPAAFDRRPLETMSIGIGREAAPSIERWSPRVRLACIVGSAALCWLVPAGLVMLWLG